MTIPNNCLECKIAYTCDALARWGEPEYFTQYADKRHKDCPYNAIAERKTGHWINITNDESLDTEWECSECGGELFLGYNPTNFCPNCGARMEGEQGAVD